MVTKEIDYTIFDLKLPAKICFILNIFKSELVLLFNEIFYQ